MLKRERGKKREREEDELSTKCMNKKHRVSIRMHTFKINKQRVKKIKSEHTQVQEVLPMKEKPQRHRQMQKIKGGGREREREREREFRGLILRTGEKS